MMFFDKKMRTGIVSLTAALVSMVFLQFSAFAQPGVQLKVLGSYDSGIFDDGASEIVSHDPATQRLYVVNGANKAVDVLDASDPTNPVFAFAIDITPFGANLNSVDVKDGVVAVAVQADSTQLPGVVVFFDTDGNYLNDLEAGALPDMVIFTHDGKYVLAANEGEPNDDYTHDPDGSVTIIDISGGVAAAVSYQADFTAYNGMEDDLRAKGVRIFGPGSSTSQDLEPEYIAISSDSKTAWVGLQENNALAVVDIESKTVLDIVPLGLKDHSVYPMDASNRDGTINITTWPTYGMYQPDAIASYSAGGEEYIVTANEGDARDYDGFSEEERVKDLQLDTLAFPDYATLQEDENLGRLKTTSVNGDADGDGYYEKIYSYGARSFSIWNSAGELVFDSGDEFARITAEQVPELFNSQGDTDSFDDRSDDKGAEPEAVAIGKVNTRTYAFIGLERISGIMVYDITDPYAPFFVQYLNTVASNGDISPEGLKFISAEDSPTGGPLLAAAHEVSGTTTIFEIAVSHDFVFLANEHISISSPGYSAGDIHANNYVRFKNGGGSTHIGNLSASNRVEVAENQYIDGDVTAGGDAQITGMVTGIITEYTDVPPLALPDFDFSAGGDNYEVDDGDTLALEPGSYGEIEVEGGGVLKLSAGDYYFEKLDFESESVLYANVDSGKININVVEELEFGSEAEVMIASYGETGSKYVTFNTLQDDDLDVKPEAVIIGNIIAPYARVELKRDSYFKGSICANQIKVREGVSFFSHGSEAPEVKRLQLAENELPLAYSSMPETVALDQNFPNPFNPTTTIRFNLPEASDISLKIFNSLGQLVRELSAGNLSAGQHSVMWDATNNQGSKVASGLYIYQLQAGEFVAHRQMLLMK